MGTRSRIAARDSAGYRSIYCHWDGYPDHVGRILRDHYTAADKVHALIALGDLSTLGADIGEKHEFARSPRGATTAYGRDRGEVGVEPVLSPDLDALVTLAGNCGAEWLYVWTGHGWQCQPMEETGDLESVDYWLQRRARG